ncbi:MAG: alpha-N-acetylglucosaminidase [Rikenellaceae bacterium]|nr:alpha-N-acetylglucosaminidase [Rikenellaceae bacterium]
MLKLIRFVSFTAIIVFSSITCRAASDEEASRGLFDRILGEKSGQFIIEKASIGQDVDYYEVESIDDKVVIRGNNSNSIAVGLNHYLRYYCLTSVSWYADDPIQLPEVLPVVPEKVVVKSLCKNRFFLNYCTFGYTMPWWQWRDWERFIDWMALNGVNMPLAITGQESIWYRVWKKLGLEDNEIRAYFTGPAHLPWHRMLNIDYWQGPLPHSWLDHQENLQKKIVSRERELGMKPVLPAFSGHVPYELKRVYPNARINKMSQWGGFDTLYRSSFLDPTDTLFRMIQKEYLDEQTKLYGTDHIYGIDPFNEIVPPSWEPDYLARVSKTIFKTLEQVDPKAVWLQMSWLYYYQRKDWTNPRIEAFVRAVPQDKMVLLDYFCERQEVWKLTDKFFGQPYIWCYLGNFGGNTMLAGNIKDVGEKIDNAMKNGGDNFWGLGSTLEGFDCNPLMYEYIFDKAWNLGISDQAWIENWAHRRVGVADENNAAGWRLLYDSIYTGTSKTGHCSMINSRPNVNKQERYAKIDLTYNNKTLLKAWGEMLNCDSKERSSYQYDIVNIGRQVLGNYFNDLWILYKGALKAKDYKEMQRLMMLMTCLMNDIDELLRTQQSFLLGKWISDARLMGIDSNEADYYEMNARNLLTTWGDKDQVLNDYANRTWAGLVSGYYYERWEMFFNETEKAVKSGSVFNYKAYADKVVDFEVKWWKDRSGRYNDKPEGDSFLIAKRLYDKYSKLICASISNNQKMH